jgi:tetratricopeptide (TPR) repeat protein
MFFQRELILNVVLAQSRAERGRIDGTGQAGKVIQLATQVFPPSILSGVEDVGQILKLRKAEADKLRTLLYSDDVQKFLDDCEEAARLGIALDWDVVSKVANLQYYRTYFEKEEDKPVQAEIASIWITRALTMNPLHVDFTIKYADILGILERYDETVAILEKLDHTSESPAYVKQWLGYWLLYVEREDEAIHYSEEYHRLFPDESDSIFNVAAAYAQKYCREQSVGKAEDPKVDSRQLALTTLKEALRGDPEFKETVKSKWTQEGQSFDCFVHDKEFRALVGLPEEASIHPTPTASSV